MTETYNKMIVITAPSGSGKTSITHHLMQVFPQLSFSISAATRLARENEKDGVDYYFISEADFQKKILADEFVEWEMVYEGKYYGTLKSELERIWSDNKIPIMDIDVQGAIHVKQEYPVNSLFLFIQPPSVEELKIRLQSRGSETQDMINVRLNKATFELSFRNNFQHVVLNQNFTDACNDAEKIVADFIKR